MSKEGKSFQQKILTKFNETCEMFDKFYELDEDESFNMNSNAEAELKKLKELYNTPEAISAFNLENLGLTTFEADVAKLENQIFYKKVADYADVIYAEFLKCAKIIAADKNAFGMDRLAFHISMHNVGTIKGDIDEGKDFNEEIAGEKLYPEIERVKALTSGDGLEEFLNEVLK